MHNLSLVRTQKAAPHSSTVMHENKIMTRKVPIICCHESTAPAFSIFNPNDWAGRSKSIIHLCAANYGLLIYTSQMISNTFTQADSLCAPSFSNLKSQYRMAKWPISNCTCFVDMPQLHLSIHSFLSEVKTFLDVLVQLTASEGIVSGEVHGFHKKGDDVGGKLLHILKNNAIKAKKNEALLLHDLIIEHKKKWIDDVVSNRDLLIHPENFATIMFVLDISEKDGDLQLDGIIKPVMAGEEFDKYADGLLSSIGEFTNQFLKYLKNA